MAFPEVEVLGESFHEKNPQVYDESVDRGQSSDVAIISTTSGTTSRPKLAQITHFNLISMGKALMEIDPFGLDDEFVSFLPMAWIGEQMMAMGCGMQRGFTLSFPEETDTVQEDLREIGPRIMFAPPRIWENMLSQVQVKIDDTTRLKRFLFNQAMKIGYRLADAKFAGRTPGAVDVLLGRLAKILVFNNLLDQLGLRHIKWAYTAGAALGPDVFRFFHGMGVNLKQGYGQTETTGICVIHSDDDIKFQTVGRPMPGVEVKTDESGEILVRGTVCFPGYFKNEAATQEAITPDGWVRTGDAGYFDEDGHLIVIDRAKDVMTLQDGTKFSPQFIENKLKFSQYVREAVVFGGDWPFVTAFINIDFGNVGKWAENHQLAYTTYTDLAQKPQVY
jgi:long-chain acyl-CoA synthetase